MQENIRFRGVAKLIGYTQLVLAILGILGLTVLFGFAIFELTYSKSPIKIPKVLAEEICDNVLTCYYGFVHENNQVLNNTLLHCGFWLITAGLAGWIAKGLIKATNEEMNIFIAIALAKRWRLWFCVSTMKQTFVIFMYNPSQNVQIATWIYLTCRALVLYFVHRYIRSLETQSFSVFSNEKV